MNLIEEYGSYESALDGLRVLESSSYEADQSYANKLKNKMLEYRRQHNIFEKEDFVVHIFYKDSKVQMVKGVAGDYIHVFSHDESYQYKAYGPDFRHATDAEIKAGERRPELDSDTCSGIRDHVSPLTKVIDR